MYYLGLDCGATHLRAQAFTTIPQGILEPAGPLLHRRFPAYDGSLKKDAAIDSQETEAGLARVELAVEAVAEAARGLEPVALAAAWAGLKCPDGNSLVFAHYGPRIENLRDRLERGLQARGVRLADPLPPLQSDGDMAGWGEEAHPQGGFRGVSTAYLLQAGTGLAEAFKSEGQILPRFAFPGILAPYAMEVNYELQLCASAWSKTDLSFAQRLALLRQFLTLRAAQLGGGAIVLGGRFREILQPHHLIDLVPGARLRLSEVEEAPVLGCAAFLRNSSRR